MSPELIVRPEAVTKDDPGTAKTRLIEALPLWGVIDTSGFDASVLPDYTGSTVSSRRARTVALANKDISSQDETIMNIAPPKKPAVFARFPIQYAKKVSQYLARESAEAQPGQNAHIEHIFSPTEEEILSFFNGAPVSLTHISGALYKDEISAKEARKRTRVRLQLAKGKLRKYNIDIVNVGEEDEATYDLKPLDRKKPLEGMIKPGLGFGPQQLEEPLLVYKLMTGDLTFDGIVKPSNMQILLSNMPFEGFMSDSDIRHIIDPQGKMKKMRTLSEDTVKLANEILAPSDEYIVNAAETGEPVYHRTTIEKGKRIEESIRKARARAEKLKSWRQSSSYEISGAALPSLDPESRDLLPGEVVSLGIFEF